MARARPYAASPTTTTPEPALPAPRPPAPGPLPAALRRPVGTVLVAGPSMLPALRDGDCLLVRRAARVRAGDVVVARFASRPGLLVVKRAVRPVGERWWVEGDNPAVQDDSRRYGPAEVLARVVLRWWPPARAGRVRRSGVAG